MDLRKLDHMPSMAAVMTPFPFAVNIHDPIEKAWELMEQHKIRHVPVRDQHALVGVVNQQDLLAFGAQNRSDASGEPIKCGYVCVAEPYVVEVGAPLDKVALEMAERHVGSAIVLKDGRLAGIFTMTDATRLLGQILESRFREPDDPLVA